MSSLASVVSKLANGERTLSDPAAHAAVACQGSGLRRRVGRHTCTQNFVCASLANSHGPGLKLRWRQITHTLAIVCLPSKVSTLKSSTLTHSLFFLMCINIVNCHVRGESVTSGYSNYRGKQCSRSIRRSAPIVGRIALWALHKVGGTKWAGRTPVVAYW